MDPQRFDALTRGLATQGTRRGLLRGLSGLTASALAAVGLGPKAAFAQALHGVDSEEQSVLLYEHLAAIADAHEGSCAALAQKVQAFRQEYATLFAQIKAEQDGWSRAKRIEHADTYGDRRQAASTKVLAAHARCQYAVPASQSGTRGTPAASPAAHASGVQLLSAQQPTPTPIPTTVPYVPPPPPPPPPPSPCCQQSCPQSTSACGESVGGCAAGDSCSCCMTSWCGSTDRCLDDCSANDCCNSACSSSNVPPPPPAGE